MLLTRKIHYHIDGKIKSEIEDLILVQCAETDPTEKLRFPKFMNSQHLPKEFIENFKYTEFEKIFRHKVTKDFLKPRKSMLDSWIFESIPYQLETDSKIKKHFIPCFSATKFFSGRASAMKNHIEPLSMYLCV